MSHDLAYYLGKDFRGEFLEQYVLTKSKPRMPLYHLIGALQKLDRARLPHQAGPRCANAWLLPSGNRRKPEGHENA